MMRNRNKTRKIALFFCVILVCLTISSCSISTTGTVNIHAWTKDVDSIATKKANHKFWSEVRSRSNLTNAHWRLGGFYQKQGKHRQAVAEFIKAIKAKTDDARIYNSLAISYDALKEYRLAEMAYKDAIALAPEKSYLYNNYACSSLLRGDREAAVILFEKAAALNSKSRRIKNNLSMASFNTDKEEAPVVSEAPVEVVSPAVEESEESTALAASSADAGNWFTDFIDSALVFLGFTEGDTNADENVGENIASAGDTTITQEKDVKDTSVSKAVQVNALQLADKLKDTLPLASNTQRAEKTEPFPHTSLSVERKSSSISDNVQVAQSNRKAAIEVSNGNGVRGIATRSAAYLRKQGQYIHSITDAKHFDFKKTIVYYREGYLQDAYQLALMVPGYQNMEQVASLERPEVSIKLLLGEDMAIQHFPEVMDGFSPQQIPQYNQTVTMVAW